MLIFRILIILLIGGLSLFGQQPGDKCSSPIAVELSPFSDFVFDTNYTCGRGNNYDQTCLEYYDGGEEIVYEINVLEAGLYEFMLNTMGSQWTGMALGYDCPPSGTIYSDCLAYSKATYEDYQSFYISLDQGTYYLMIDTWPAPDCIPEFELVIGPPIIEYFYDCNMPYIIELPLDNPVDLTSRSTCGLGNRYNSTCLGNYDGGDDMMFYIYISEPGNLSVRLNPFASGWTGMALGAQCPPPGVSLEQCLAYSTSNNPDVHGFDIDLAEGEYYLMIDTWPAPDCIENFDLSINFDPDFLCGDANSDEDINVSDAVYLINYIFSNGSEPVPLSSADANCDGDENVSDAVWIINFVFSSGFIPCDVDGDQKLDCLLK